MHSKNFLKREDHQLQEDFLKSKEMGVLHFNGVGSQSLFYDFLHFQTSLQLPQCSSHDYLEGCAKLWLLLILEHLFKQKCLLWQSLERIIRSFPYKGKDARNRPTVLLSKKMKHKSSRQVIGTFSETRNFI